MKKPAHPAVEGAQNYLGYTSRPDKRSMFGPPGLNWDGAFVDAIFKDLMYEVPSHQHTAAALAFYVRSGRIFQDPQPGDIVLFAFAPGPGHQPESSHIGIVSDVSSWKSDRIFRSIEGQVSSGQPKSTQEENGVYERTRHESDVIGFARPKKLKRPGLLATSHIGDGGLVPGKDPGSGIPVIHPGQLLKCLSANSAAAAGPKNREAVEIIQIALSQHPGVKLKNADRGIFNLKSRRALSAFQRFNGRINPDGLPDVETLEQLARTCNPPLFIAGE